MAEIVGSVGKQQISASKRSWAESLDAELGPEKLPEQQQVTHEEYQPKRSRNMPDGDSQMDDYEISNGSLPSCYESGSDSAEKSLRSDELFHNHTSSNEELNNGESPTTHRRPPDGYEDPTSSTHSTDSNFYDEVESGSPVQDSPSTSPKDSTQSTSGALTAESSSTQPQEQGQDHEDDEDNISTISELSGISIEGWRPVAGPISWVQRQMQSGVDPRTVLRQLVPQDALIPEDFDDLTLWKIVINLIAEPPKRSKIKTINSLGDVLHLLKSCNKIMVLTGAGVSVSCGIPDFRSRDGIYSRLAVEYPDLPDPQAMFDIVYFKKNPKPFFKFAKEIYPGQFMPSPSHRFISLLESKDKLLRNYTQNIDTLEQVAGIDNVIQCHGSFATATCMVCKCKVDKEVVKEDIMNQVIPQCPKCLGTEEIAIMKPDIVFFGESLPSEFHRQMEIDRDVCDLLIVIGSSLKVRPVALIPDSLPAEVPQILINREPLQHLNFDVELLGDCDVIVNELCHQLGTDWESICTLEGPCREVSRGDIPTPPASRRTSPMLTPTSDGDSSSRMSFQVGTVAELDETSQMSTNIALNSTDTKVPEPQHNTDTKLPVPQPEAGSSMAQNDSTASLCLLVDHLTTTTTEVLVESPQPVEKSPMLASTSTSATKVSEFGETKPDAVKVMDKTAEEKVAEEKTLEEINDLEDLRACWEPRIFNLAARLQNGTYLFMPPARYVFHGAEVYDETSCSNDEQTPDDDSDSDSSSNSDMDSAIQINDAKPSLLDAPLPEASDCDMDTAIREELLAELATVAQAKLDAETEAELAEAGRAVQAKCQNTDCEKVLAVEEVSSAAGANLDVKSGLFAASPTQSATTPSSLPAPMVESS